MPMPPDPPDNSERRPVLLFDGECGFCRFWVDRWRRQTGPAIDYAPFQSVEADGRLKKSDLEEAIHLVEADGSVTRGAAAVFRARELGMGQSRLARVYRRSPLFARGSEYLYAFVARHRPFFSCLTRSFRGRK